MRSSDDAGAGGLPQVIPGYPVENERILRDPGEIARFHARCSDLMRELLAALSAYPELPRPFPEVEDAMRWPRRRIASVLGGVSRLRHREFDGARPYHFLAPRDAASRRWEILDGRRPGGSGAHGARRPRRRRRRACAVGSPRC